MGRHSRPEDTDDALEAGEPDDPTAVLDDADAIAGRHSVAPDASGSPAAGSAVDARPRPRPARKALHGTAADVRLLRERADVRNRCVAAVLVPFVVYTVVLLLLGTLDAYLIWIFAPTILAGLLVGAILDHAHKRYPD